MNYVLAPLAGFTDAPFRRLCFENGADLTYTEMVSVAGLSHGSSPTRHLMETMLGEGPVALQVFGSNENDFKRVFEGGLLSPLDRFVEINLNAGCPMTKVTREGAGSKLIEDPAKIERILRIMVQNVSLPVTLKTRLGPHPRETKIFEILEAAERAGAKGLIVHARYTSQMHGGAVHLDRLAEVVRRAHIPVTGNGSIVDHASARAMKETGVSALMIGRAALAHPDIFSILRASNHPATTTSSYNSSSSFLKTHLSYLLAFREQLAARFPVDHIPSVDGYASVKMHTHLFRYLNGRPGAAALRKRLNSVRTLSEINDIISACVSG